MNETSSSHHINYFPHYLILCLLFLIFHFFSKSKQKVKSEDFTEEDRKKGHHLMLKYIIVFEFAKAADWCLGPFIFEFFKNYHSLTLGEIGKLQALSFTSNLFVGPIFIGFLNDKSNKKIPCLLFSILLISVCIIRMIRHPICLIVSQIFFGCASSILYTSFENWLITEAIIIFPSVKIREMVLSSIFEKSMVFDSIIAVSVSIVAGKLNKLYGIQAPYLFSCLLSVLCFTLVLILVPSLPPLNINKEHKEISNPLSNLKVSVKTLFNRPFLALIGMTESLLLATLHIFIFSWTPVLKSLNPSCDTGNIFTLFMIGLIVGGTAFKAFYMYFGNPMNVAMFVSGLSTLAFLITILIKQFNYNLFGFLIFEISIGMLYPTYSMIKAAYLPEKIRGTIMSLFKIPLHLIVIFMLITTESLFSIDNFLIVNLLFCSIVFLIHVSLFKGLNQGNK